MTDFRTGATVVFAHGAWADGSSFADLVGPLEAVGLKVVAAPLPLTSLSEDVQAIKRVIDRTTGPVLLAAHAYAGGAIGGVHHDRVVGYAYIAALAPDEGQTVADVFYKDEPHPQAPKLAPDDNGLIWLPDDAFASAFAQDAEPERLAELAAAQRPISIAAITEPAGRPGWKDKPSFYLIAQSDRMIPEATQRFMADRMKAVTTVLNVDHAPMVTAPEATTNFVLEAARQLLAD
jgi:pimeloyl-ACP methyl ester carboxylesterase